MAFSPGLVLSDLSDYLAPSQICIKPVGQVEDPRGSEEEAEHGGGAAATEIRLDEETKEYFEVERPVVPNGGDRRIGTAPREKKLKKAQITLNDCLACSGCITSAESVLVSMQSHEEVRSVLGSRFDLLPILSIAPQPIASLAALHGLPQPSVLAGLRRFFKRAFGFRLVLDTTWARELSLCEGRREFMERFSSSSCTAAADGPLPLLSSSCPGWICYAEKTHGELLPFISRVKSSQQIQGSLVKGKIAEALGVAPEKVYHVALMMCYDKKLEASRPDFLVPGQKEGEVAAREVDCVLTTGEVQKLMDEEGWDLRRASEEAHAERGDEDEEMRLLPDSLPPRGSSSGGALHNILQGVISSLSPPDLARAALRVEPRRGQDYVDYTLSLAGSSRPLFKGARCYGFRNLQNVVRKVGRERGVAVTRGAAGATVGGPAGGRLGGKSVAASAAAARRAARRNRPDGGPGSLSPSAASSAVAAAAAAANGSATEERPYDYIEVMACPSGCVNGGGQVPPPKRASAPVGNGADGEPGAIVGDGEVKVVNGRDGPVWSVKDWVAEVERVYWSSCAGPLALNGAGFLHPSVFPYALPPSEWEVKAQKMLDRMGERERKRVMRTGYRAVESEEVNGLAVKW